MIIFFLGLYILRLGAEGAQPQNVSLEFPVFNSSVFSCTGIPSVVAYRYCVFNGSASERIWAEVLPPTFNNIYPNQAARMMYTTPIPFRNADSSIIADWSTFLIFTVEQVVDQPMVGSGLAFLIAPEIDTPTDSASGGFGLFPMDPSTGQPASGTKPMVIAVEFDTQMTDGIDVLDVPHIGIDLNSLVSANASYIGTEVFNTSIGMWVDYNNTLQTLSVYASPLDVTDASGASQKPDTPLITRVSFSSVTYQTQQAYIGISAGVFSGGFEVNKVRYWTFKTFGFPAPVVVATWYQWWKGVSNTKKIGLIAGAVVGTILGAYICSECLFFCFFQRIKHPATAAEQRWPVRRRTTLPGTKPKIEPPRRRIRDSLSVAKPLDLWSAPLGADGEPAVDFLKRPESDLKAMAELNESSDSEGGEHAEFAIKGFDHPGQNLDQSWDGNALDPAAVSHPEEAETPGQAEEEIESSPGEEEKAGLPVDMPDSPVERPPEAEKKLGIKTDPNDAPLIEKKPSETGKEAPVLRASKVPPGAVNPSSPSKQRSLFSGEKPGEKAGVAPAAKLGSELKQIPSQAGQTVAPQARQPGLDPQERPSAAGKTVAPPGAPQAAKPGSPPQERPSPAGKTVAPPGAPQAAKPGSPPQERPSPASKIAAPPGAPQGSPPQERPSPAGKTVAPPGALQAAKRGSPPPSQAGITGAPQAEKPGSLPQEKPSPQATKPGSPPQGKPSPQTTKPGSPTQEKPSQQTTKPGSPAKEKPSPDKKMSPQAAQPGSPPQVVKPGSPPQHKLSSVDKTTAPQAGKPGSPPKQQKPSQPGKTVAPQTTKPGLLPMPGPWQGEQAKPEAGPRMVAPQTVKKTPPPAGATAAPQKSPPPSGPSQGAGSLQVPRKEQPKAPRPSPQISPPKAAASPQTSSKAVPRPTPQSPPKK